MAALRAVLLAVLFVIVGFVAYAWLSGQSFPHRADSPSTQATGTSGTIDV